MTKTHGTAVDAREGMRSGAAGPLLSIAMRDRNRLRFLDALRGLAAAYVLVYHMLLLPQPNLSVPRWAEKSALAGGMGVTLFFVVSAFSLYYTMPLRLKDARPTLSFYLHRFFRIAPLFYFWIIASMVRDWFQFDARHSAVDIAATASFAFNLIPAKQESFVWAGWTIGVEMLFYAAFPFLYHRIRSTAQSIAFVFVCLLAWLLAQSLLDYLVLPDAWKQSILHWSVLRHLPVFAVGMLLYHWFVSEANGRLSEKSRKSHGQAFLWAGLFAFAALLQGWLPNIFGDGYYWQAVVFALIFIGLALCPWRLLVNRATTYLGKISYSVYLSHTTAIFFLAPVYRLIYERSPSLTVSFLVALLLTFAIVIPVSALTYRLIEEPGIRFGKRIASRLAQHASAAPASPDPQSKGTRP